MSWQPLTRLHPCHGEPQHYEFLFPCEDKPRRPTRWKYLLVEVVEWLFENGFLKPSHCPIRLQGAPIRYMVHTEPRHADGSCFSNCKRVGGLYIEVDEWKYELHPPDLSVETKDNDDILVKNATKIIEQVAPRLLDRFLFRGQPVQDVGHPQTQQPAYESSPLDSWTG